MKAIVTCDIIKSRRYSGSERQQLNKLIEQSYSECSELITEADTDKLSFSIIQGDEYQFMINNPEYAYQFVFFKRLLLSRTPLRPRFRAAIGIGDIAVSADNLYQMDGSAFHFSREAMQRFKDSAYRDRSTFFKTGIDKMDEQLNLIAMYNDSLEDKFTAKQIEAIILYRKFGTYEKAASHTGFSIQAIQQRVVTSGWKQISKGFEKQTELINSISQP
jgi:hypothetical protein